MLNYGTRNIFIVVAYMREHFFVSVFCSGSGHTFKRYTLGKFLYCRVAIATVSLPAVRCICVVIVTADSNTLRQ